MNITLLLSIVNKLSDYLKLLLSIRSSEIEWYNFYLKAINNYLLKFLKMKNIAIIGSGISGLSFAKIFKKKVSIEIFEKSRGVGGRMATRRAYPYKFNHGAQYFKIKNSNFGDFLKPLINNKIIRPWNANYVEIKNKVVIKREKWNYDTKHYVGYPKMSSVAKFISKDSVIKFSCKIVRIYKKSDGWYLYDSDKIFYGPYDWIVCTMPPKQAIELLPLNFKYFDIIKNIKMRSCFSLMLGFNKNKEIKYDAALFKEDDLQWVSSNKTYENNNSFTNILINSSYDFAEKNIDSSINTISNYLVQKASENTNVDLTDFKHKALHFWRYAMSDNRNKFGSFIDEELKIIVCGDWCINGNVESAFLSAKNAAHNLLKNF